LKREHGYVDFDDMLDDFLEKGEPPELDLLLVDEAQDLTAKTWRCVEKLAERTALVYLAGDDDQMLYRWAGADDGAFRSYFEGALVLEQSYRCSKAVARRAHDVIRPVQHFPKAWRPTEEEGEVIATSDFLEAPLREGQWFVLCRTNGRVRTLARELKEHLIYYQTVTHGVTERGYSQAMTRLLRWWKAQPFVSDRDDQWALKTLQLSELREVPKDLAEFLRLTYDRSGAMTLEDMGYALHLHQAGEDVLEAPRITVMTFHQAKGLEADNVVIDTHGSKRMRDEWVLDHGPETRMAYVAMTRARRQVWLYDQYGTSLDCWEWQ
jgi:superfamily I DNA/RNA helicase